MGYVYSVAHIGSEGTSGDEAHMAAEADSAEARTRLPRTDGDPRRPQGAGRPPGSRPDATDRLVTAATAHTPRSQRLRASRDFAAVARSGRRTRHRLLSITLQPNDLPYSRYGFAVSRRVGGAVVRNLVRRRLREILRLLPLRAGYDIVITAHADSASARFRELEEALQSICERSRILATPSR